MITIAAHLIGTLDEQKLVDQLGLNNGGRIQHVINSAVIRECQPYVPASPHRTLEFSVISDVDNGQVIWNTPYARYQYYGVVMTDELGRTWVGPGEKKPIVTDRPLNYDTSQNPMAGSYWFERMKADHFNDILEEAEKAMTGGA